MNPNHLPGLVDLQSTEGNNEIRLLSFDIDNTLIDLATLQGRFGTIWEKYLKGNGLILAYNSGRLYEDVLQLIDRKILPEAHYIIGGVGTHIYDLTRKSVIKEFSEVLDEGWDPATVEEIIDSLSYPITIQPSKYQHFYKRSYFLKEASILDIEQIEERFSDSTLDVNVVYSGNQYLDILPKWANKGNALQWLLKDLEIPYHHALVAGDSGNDAAMFEVAGIKGVAVGNARPELYRLTKYKPVFHAEREREAGVVEGLIHYGLLPHDALDDITLDDEAQEEFFIHQLTDHHEVKDEKLDLIRAGYQQAIQALKRNISPLGFLAAPVEGNEAVGTDENYHSVWARDGAITIIGTLSLTDDEEIHECQRKTLMTILDNVSINGQVPSNVRLKDAQPDYSGVGGICSIDSGLWMVIAFYQYIRVIRDFDLLHKYMPILQKVMGWLSAQDGNNDALLEIPEAGDWTDLFGRSYHILYDEVLWYRANVCFGRLLELLGNYEDAGGYMRWSQVIKREILSNFWPSTQQKLFQSVSFAERQFSLGDTKYLVAQITPFDYSWRCDALGNILAFLFNVMDVDKAHSAFKFMLGVGINQPYPVSNVYPVVSPGDPDWRPYYTVNLLNLPHHYHNGGIWPFIGGFWVQFIHKMGQSELALSEMFKLAKLNQLGINEQWEFNEWVHGSTGNPMGKSYQAWSAAQYIAAYHTLKIK